MELLAAGFNAWAQLYPEGPSHNDVAHEDLRTFTRVLHGSTIDQVQAFLSHTIVRSDAASKGAGHCPRDHAQLYESDRRTYSTLAETATGAIVSAQCLYAFFLSSIQTTHNGSLMSRLSSTTLVQFDNSTHSASA